MFKSTTVIQTAARVLLAILVSVYLSVGCVVVVAAVEARTTSTNNTVAAENIPYEPDTVQTVVKQELTPVIDLIDKPIHFAELEYKIFYDIPLSKEYIMIISDAYVSITTAITSGKYSDNAVSTMENELARLRELEDRVKADINKYTTWEQEHYYAAKTYEFLMQKGYSAEIACAIIGNMMVETSGGTLALNPTIYSPGKSFYGLCQWSLYYKPYMANMSFYEQLEYLHDDMEKEFKTFGFCYKKNFTYEDFLSMKKTDEAAIAFAKVYERCGSGSYIKRADCAKIAYRYFSGIAY